MRSLRIAGIVVASLAALLAGGVLLAWLLFDPNAYKDELQRAFQGATGRELRLDGPLSLSVFPWLAVETGAASVSNRAGFGAEPFAALDRARLGVRLWPLLSARRVELGPVRVDGLALNLAIARDGSNNWSDLLERFEKAPAPAGTEDSSTSGQASIARLDLRGAALRLADAQAGTRYVIDRWDLATGMLRKGEPFDVETSLRLARNDAPIGRLKLRTRVHPDQADRLVFEDSEGTLRLARSGRDDLPVALSAPRIAVTNATRDIAIENLEARIGDAVLAATLRVEQGQAGPQARGRVQLAETNPRELLRELGLDPPATRDPKALTRIAGAADLAYSARDGLQVDARDLRLDATTLSGRIALADFERRAIRFDLRGDGIDLDRYLPPPAPAGTRPSPAAPAGGATAKATDASPLDVRGAIAFGRVVVAAIPLQDVVANVRLAGGRLALDPLKARVFDGSSITRLDYELAAPVPTLQIEQRLADVDVGAMLGQLVQVRQLQGRGNGHFVLTTRGAGAEALFANLAGPYDLTVTNGALVGTDLWFEIERAMAAAQLEPSAVTGKSSGRTEFSRLAARGTIGDRTLRNEHVEFVSDFARVRGRGRIDYGRDELDLDLTARLLKAPPGRFLGIKVRRLEGADIPLKVTGKMSEPQVRPNVSKLLEAAAKDAIKEPLEGKIKEKLEKLFKF